MDAKLKERAQKVAALTNSRTSFTTAQINEVAAVHHALTGRTVACTTCNVYGLLNEIKSKLTQEPLIIKDMANAQFKFKSQAEENTMPIRHTPAGPVIITSENLNKKDNGEWMAKNFPHLVEETKAAKTETAETTPKTESKTSAKK